MTKNNSSLDGILDALQSDSASEESFRLLFELFYPRLYHFFSRRGLSPDDCLDLIQETFLGIYRGIGSFRRDSRFETWLFQVALNAFRKMGRRGATRKRSAKEVPLDGCANTEHVADREFLVSETPSPADEALRKERSRRVRTAIETLPGQMRKCLLLRIDQGLKYRQIGAVMRLSIGTVRGHLFEARRRLQKEMGPDFARTLSMLDEGESS